ncbi:MAG: hypothetical protein Q4E57_10160 [Eubacteriales bacterium]|nr:hypothetical protein [Eubacteriales bacterium]
MFVKDIEEDEIPAVIRYCPFCGESVNDRDSDGSCHCESCGKRFNVIDIM